ncbi:MAG: molybdenum cofactor biosynthesis protein MoaE [Pseudomonadota bacterium]|nr:molybdenum cofactor biosynthesis protein MoaE [Pseudomonadota bacterium]
MIRVQKEDFDAGREIGAISARNFEVGGVASFIGLVRGANKEGQIIAMTLEHYPGMTEKILFDLEVEARTRWRLEDLLIIHRYGRMTPGEQIVLVITASAHREDALQSCQFLIDRLKIGAPFWKKEETPVGSHWVESKAEDDIASERWQK